MILDEQPAGSMGHFLRVSAIMGASSLFTIVSGIIKSKAIAILVGPSGIGLFGLLFSVQATVATLFGLGLSNSGVRFMAEAQTSGQSSLLSETRRALCIGTLILGTAGALLLLLLRFQVSRLAMGNEDYADAVGWLSLGVLFTILLGAQSALLNGLRRLHDLAITQATGAVAGMCIGVGAVWLWKTPGIIVAVLAVPALSLCISLYFTNKIRIPDIQQFSIKAICYPFRKMAGLGVFMMATGLMTVGSQLLVRAIVLRSLGMDAVGYFQAAWSISMLYLGFILGAMGTDYYPRLSSVAANRDAVNRMVNEQAEFAMLLAGPVLLGLLTFAPQVISILYSRDFQEAFGVLRWQMLGDVLKIPTWAIGFILLAKGAGKVFFFTEMSWNLLYVLLVWFGLDAWGIEATGIAFFLSYFVTFLIIWSVVRYLNGFSWTGTNLTFLGSLLLSVLLVFLARLAGPIYPLLLGGALTVGSATFSFIRISRSLNSATPGERRER